MAFQIRKRLVIDHPRHLVLIAQSAAGAQPIRKGPRVDEDDPRGIQLHIVSPMFPVVGMPFHEGLVDMDRKAPGQGLPASGAGGDPPHSMIRKSPQPMSRTQAVHIIPDRITPSPSCRFTQHLAEKPCPPRRRQRLQIRDQGSGIS